MRIIAVVNQKGGVGKTTTSVNLGAGLASRGRRVLLVDMDPQGNLTDHLLPPIDGGRASNEAAPRATAPPGSEASDRGATGAPGVGALGAATDPPVRPSIYDVLVEGRPIADAVVATSTPGLFVVPSHEDLSGAELDLAAVIGREVLLRDALADLSPDAFDYVFLDCPPSLGLLSLNALAAADEVFIALQTEFFAMRGLAALGRTIDLVRRRINTRLVLGGIVATLVDPTRLSREILDEVRSHYGERVFTTRIRTNVRLAEAPSHGRHIFDYAPDSAGAADYAELAAEVEEGPRTAVALDAATAAAALPNLAPTTTPPRPPAPRRSSIATAIAEAAAAVGGGTTPPSGVAPVPVVDPTREGATQGPAAPPKPTYEPAPLVTPATPSPPPRRALPSLPLTRPGRPFALTRMPIRAQPAPGARAAP